MNTFLSFICVYLKTQEEEYNILPPPKSQSVLNSNKA